jgi:hypothetical protein
LRTCRQLSHIIQNNLTKVVRELLNQAHDPHIPLKWSRDPPEEIVLEDLMCSQHMVGIDLRLKLKRETRHVFVPFLVSRLVWECEQGSAGDIVE